ncbi:MAG TPA: ADOP family duplicated permease [Gemmatimonadales bacterium]|nr:ADOP family duplicated permease [Gemmatimonadales bacterium]
MSWLDGISHKLRSVFRPGAHARELEEEVRFHLELEAAQVNDPDAARRRFGNRVWYAEETRRMTWLRVVDRARQDVGSAWRSLTRAPAVTAVVAGTLAVGIGANAAAFTLLDALYLKPPGGVSDPGSLRRYWFKNFKSGTGVPFTAENVNYPVYRLVAEAGGQASNTALFSTDWSLRQGKGFTGPKLRAVYASANYFPVLGVHPELGRFYTPAEDQLGAGAQVAVVSHAFWKRRLDGARPAPGQVIEIGPRSYQVIGVMDPAFTGLDLQAADVWIPLATYPMPSWMTGSWWEHTDLYDFRMVQRQAPGVAEATLEGRITTLVRNYNREAYPRHPDTLMTVRTGGIIEARGPGEPGQDLLITTRLAGVAAIVLLIALANVINLMLSRAVERGREIALRLALGLSRGRLIWILTLETLLVALMAGAASMAVGWVGGGLLRKLILPDIEWVGSALGWRVALFTIGVAIACGAIAGILPAIQASRPVLNDALKAGRQAGGRHRSRLRDSLVVLQAALSMTLLVGAALFVKSLKNVEALDIGFDAPRLVFGELEFEQGTRPDAATADPVLRGVAARLRGRPGIAAVARASVTPMRAFRVENFFAGSDSTASLRPTPFVVDVSPEYFAAAGLRILKGRAFPGADGDSGPADVVVNEAMARQVWPGKDPVGQCMYFKQRNTPCRTVVGVVETSRVFGLIEHEPGPQYYLPLGASERAGWNLVVRTTPGGTQAASAELRNELRAAFPKALATVTPMTTYLEPEYRPWRLGATLFTLFGLLALLVALVGIYSTVSYGVSQRTHEFGVRMALGAVVGDVVRQVVGEGVRVVAVGVLVGVALALAQGRLVAALLYGIKPGNTGVLLIVSATLLAVAAVAAMLPAWRAARVDPATVLRAD